MTATAKLNAILGITPHIPNKGKCTGSAEADILRQCHANFTWPGSIPEHLLQLLEEISDNEEILRMLLSYGNSVQTRTRTGHVHAPGNFILRSTGEILDVTTYNIALTLFPDEDLRPEWMYRAYKGVRKKKEKTPVHAYICVAKGLSFERSVILGRAERNSRYLMPWRGQLDFDHSAEVAKVWPNGTAAAVYASRSLGHAARQRVTIEGHGSGISLWKGFGPQERADQ